LSDQEEETRGRLSAKNFSKHPKTRSQWPLAENPAAARRPVREPKSFGRLWARIPEGMLLIGPPGRLKGVVPHSRLPSMNL